LVKVKRVSPFRFIFFEGGFGELVVAGDATLAEFGAQLGLHTPEVHGFGVAQLAFEEELLGFLEHGGKPGEFAFFGGEQFFLERFQLDSAQGAEFRGVIAIPVNESALGHAKVLSDSGEAKALGTQFEETIFYVGCVHTVIHSVRSIHLYNPPACSSRPQFIRAIPV
jgi:hypothetical protein